MIKPLHPRITENKDWAKPCFRSVICYYCDYQIYFENRQADFANLIFSNKYTKVLEQPFKKKVDLLLYAFQRDFRTNVRQFRTRHYCFTSRSLRFGFFILSKYLIEKIITLSNIERNYGAV
jgi:hypothetical protein